MQGQGVAIIQDPRVCKIYVKLQMKGRRNFSNIGQKSEVKKLQTERRRREKKKQCKKDKEN